MDLYVPKRIPSLQSSTLSSTYSHDNLHFFGIDFFRKDIIHFCSNDEFIVKTTNGLD